MVRDAPRLPVGAAGPAGVLRRARCSWPTTRRSTSGTCGPRAAATARRGRAPRWSAPRGSGAASSPATRRRRAGSRPWRRSSGRGTRPIHRALDDARATVDVLHGLLERVGGRGVSTLEDLLALQVEVSPAQRAKRHLADAVPEQPGVYLFRGPGDEVLYVGTSGDLRRRVRSYFTGGDKRARIKEMIGLVERVDWVVCAHALEAEVRELRLLAGHAPRYNRRSRFPHRGWWVALTDEPFPRLSVVRTPRADAVGPFGRRPDAVAAVAGPAGRRAPAARAPSASRRAGRPGTPCALHEMGRCGGAVRGPRGRRGLPAGGRRRPGAGPRRRRHGPAPALGDGGRPRRRRALRGRRGPPRPPRRPRRRPRARAAPVRRGRGAGDDRRPPGRRARVGPRGRPARTPRGGRARPPRACRRCRWSRRSWPPPRPCAPATARCAARRPRRSPSSPAGSNGPGTRMVRTTTPVGDAGRRGRRVGAGGSGGPARRAAPSTWGCADEPP